MASPAWIGLATAAGWFCVFAGIQISGLRAGLGGARSLVIACTSSTAGMLLTVIATMARSGTHPLALAMALAMGLLASACLFVLYVPALYTVLTSLSVQTLILLGRGGGALPESELFARFSGRALFEDRLQTLADSGYVARSDGRYRLTSRGRAVAKTFAAIKELWRLGPGG